jgi:hypothetical protein
MPAETRRHEGQQSWKTVCCVLCVLRKRLLCEFFVRFVFFVVNSSAHRVKIKNDFFNHKEHKAHKELTKDEELISCTRVTRCHLLVLADSLS